MNKQLEKLQRNRLQRETASTLLLVTVFMVGLFGFAALTIDVGRAYKEKRHEQLATDAGAYAAVVMLNTNLSADAAAVNAKQEATDVSAANGISSSELSNGVGGGVQVGIWANGQFLANTKTNGLYTAVQVSAQRNVGMLFAKVVGMSSMNPSVHSVADLESAGIVANVIPFGISPVELTNQVFGSTYQLNDTSVGSGKQGKVNLANYQTPNDWKADMTANGCNCTVSVGTVPVITGNAQVSQSFNGLASGTILAMPVVSQSGSGNSIVGTISGFVIVKLLDSNGSGSGWTADVQFLAQIAGTGGGGSCPPPCVQARTIVQ